MTENRAVAQLPSPAAPGTDASPAVLRGEAVRGHVCSVLLRAAWSVSEHAFPFLKVSNGWRAVVGGR